MTAGSSILFYEGIHSDMLLLSAKSPKYANENIPDTVAGLLCYCVA